MIYDELNRRYGSYVANRVRQELSFSEFSALDAPELLPYLEQRAEEAHKDYQERVESLVYDRRPGMERDERTDALFARWRAAEELSYIVAVAEDVNANAARHAAGGA